MKIKNGFELRTIARETFIIEKGARNIDFIKIISLNESAVYLWNQVQGKDFDAPFLANLLQQEYAVDADTALTDAEAFVSSLQEAGLVE